MKERIGSMIGQAVEGMPWLGTFHSIGVKVLRRHAELVGLKTRLHHPRHRRPDPAAASSFSQAEGIDEKRWPARHLAGLIDHWKNARADAGHGAGRRRRGLRQRPRQELYQAFQERLKVAERGGLRRPAAGDDPAVPRAPGRAGAVSAPVPVHPGG